MAEKRKFSLKKRYDSKLIYHDILLFCSYNLTICYQSEHIYRMLYKLDIEVRRTGRAHHFDLQNIVDLVVRKIFHSDSCISTIWYCRLS